ncbi:hypothetical protein AB1K70_10625 [Bremerella sp. JC770]|uniref:hypothetical protein n=1 Tax=Bremerella sp. JC770 TaxID=3232137 RepID=UPI0034588ABD
MKNIYLRLAVIGGVVALGATAIGQSMMASRDPDPEPIEISQIPPGTSPQQLAASFPQSQVVLASNDTPAEKSEGEPTPAKPPVATATPTPAARFSISDAQQPEHPTPAASNPAAAGEGSAPPSRFSRFLGSSSANPAESEGSAPASTPTPAATSTAAGSRFSIGDSPTPAAGNPAASDTTNPAASSPTPPGPQSFATDAAGPTPASPAGMSPPPVRFQTGAAAVAGAAAGAAAAQTRDTASAIASEANAVAGQASSAVSEAAESANNRFSSMVNSASQSIADQADAAANAVSQQMPETAPVQPRFSSNAGSNPAASATESMPATPPNPTRFSATNTATSTPQPSVMGSATPPSYGQTRGFSASPSPAPAAMDQQPQPSYQETAQPQPTRFAQPTQIASLPSAADGAMVSARPGEIHLEGDQQPSIRLEKVAPPEVQVGKVTTFEVHVENNGQVDASSVVVRDMVPAGTKLVSTSPQAQQGADGSLVWELGTLRPQERKTLKLEILPMEEGNIGSVASVVFSAKASAKSIVTRPKLEISQASAGTVLAGNQLGITITITNPGTGAASGVVLEENVPGNFNHPAGKELEFEVGTLKPGESRQLNLVLNAVSAGRVQNVLRARADGNLTAEHAVELEVVAPKLQVAMTGPKLRYLERPAKYTVSVSNPGTAPAHEIDVVTYLPKGLKFVEANNAGQYDSTRHAVYWNLQELPPAQTGTVELVALPIEPGDQRLRVEGSANKGLTAEDESTVRVEGLAAMYFEVADLADPIEVGKQTTYEIKVVNQGSKEAKNVHVTAALPPGLRAIAADGEVPGQVQGPEVVFQPIGRIDPKQTVRLQIQVQGTMPGDQRIRVQVRTDGIPDPITKEESTTVYTDQ